MNEGKEKRRAREKDGVGGRKRMEIGKEKKTDKQGGRKGKRRIL